MTPDHLLETCLTTEVEEALDRLTPTHELIAMSSHQVGSGYGAFIQVLLVFRLRSAAPAQANGNGNGHRRKMIPTIRAKKVG
jgi:hypothetical protein